MTNADTPEYLPGNASCALIVFLFIDKIYVPAFNVPALSNGSMAGGKTIRSTGLSVPAIRHHSFFRFSGHHYSTSTF